MAKSCASPGPTHSSEGSQDVTDTLLSDMALCDAKSDPQSHVRSMHAEKEVVVDMYGVQIFWDEFNLAVRIRESESKKLFGAMFSCSQLIDDLKFSPMINPESAAKMLLRAVKKTEDSFKCSISETSEDTIEVRMTHTLFDGYSFEYCFALTLLPAEIVQQLESDALRATVEEMRGEIKTLKEELNKSEFKAAVRAAECLQMVKREVGQLRRENEELRKWVKRNVSAKMERVQSQLRRKAPALSVRYSWTAFVKVPSATMELFVAKERVVVERTEIKAQKFDILSPASFIEIHLDARYFVRLLNVSFIENTDVQSTDICFGPRHDAKYGCHDDCDTCNSNTSVLTLLDSAKSESHITVEIAAEVDCLRFYQNNGTSRLKYIQVCV